MHQLRQEGIVVSVASLSFSSEFRIKSDCKSTKERAAPLPSLESGDSSPDAGASSAGVSVLPSLAFPGLKEEGRGAVDVACVAGLVTAGDEEIPATAAEGEAEGRAEE